MITLLQLGTALATDLEPGPSGHYSAIPIAGVHVSELEDPTPYLSGGELLLTTGMIFARGCRRNPSRFSESAWGLR